VNDVLAVWRCLRADLRSRPLPAALVVLTLAAATAMVTVGASVTASVQGPYDRLFNQTAGAHLWVAVSGDPQAAASRLARLPGVEAETAGRPEVQTEVFVGSAHHTAIVQGLEPSPRVAHPLVTAGRLFDPGETDVIVLDRNFAQLNHRRVGDEVGLLTPSGAHVLRVVGLALNAQLPPYVPEATVPQATIPLLFVPGPEVAALFGPAGAPGGVVGLRLADPDAVLAAWTAASSALGDSATDFTDWRSTRDQVGFLVRTAVIFLLAFGVLATLASGLIIGLAIQVSLQLQVRSIGLLRTIGFTPRQVTWLLAGEYALLGTVAGVAGYAIGLVLAPAVLAPVTDVLNVSAVPVLVAPLAVTVIAGCAGFAALVSWLMVRRLRRARPIDIIAATPGPPAMGGVMAGGALRSLTVRISVNDLLVRPARAALTALTLAAAFIAVVGVLQMNSALRLYDANPALRGFAYDARFVRHDIPDQQARDQLTAQSGVAAYYGDVQSTVRIEGTAIVVPLDAVTGRVEAFDMGITAGRLVRGPGEAVAGEAVLRVLGKRVGERLTVTTGERRRELTIVGASPFFNLGSGLALMSDLQTLVSLVPQASPMEYFVKVTGRDPTSVIGDVERATNYQLLGESVKLTIPADVRALRSLLGALSVYLLALALLSLVNMTLMRTYESLREFALMKAIGFTPRQVVSTVVTSTSLLSTVTLAAAVPIGLLTAYGALALVAHTVYHLGVPLAFAVDWPQLLGALLLTEVVAILAGLVPARAAVHLRVGEIMRRA
jgi:putative ABC transport system permease protein